MSQLSRKYSEETGDDPVIMNSVAYSTRYVNWLEAKVENLTAHNTASLKLPEYGEVVNEVFGDGGVRSVPAQEANSVRHCYDIIVRQLQA